MNKIKKFLYPITPKENIDKIGRVLFGAILYLLIILGVKLIYLAFTK